MGDGKAMRHGLILCTNSFTIQDAVRLVNVLIIKYNLKCTIYYNNQQPQIYISHHSMSQLRSIVSPNTRRSTLCELSF